MTDECSTCRFWVERSDSAKDLGGGYCRRYPPAFPTSLTVWKTTDDNVMATIDVSSHEFVGAWPFTHQQSWCGEYQGKGRA